MIPLAAMLALAAPARAADPQLGGEMKHIFISFDGSSLSAEIDDAVPVPFLTLATAAYAGAASVLNGTHYNAQYGWLVDGFWAPPAGSHLRIEQIAAPAALRCYSGGSMAGVPSFTPIFGTAGSPQSIRWNGQMLHNWYAADTALNARASYRVFFSDSAGTPLAGYGQAEVTLTFGEAVCAADLNGDGLADFGDVAAFVTAFTAQDLSADLNADGLVDFGDVSAFVDAFLAGC
jgi:hypothetical protein